jgi:uncharacterized membrane protein YozB (DUF420 family)
MSTGLQPGRGASRLRPKYLLFAFIGFMIAYVLYHNESFLFDSADPVWKHYAGIKMSLLPHGIAGAIALFLGISQFSSRLRSRHIMVHRTLGRIYVCAVAIAAPLGILTQYLDELDGDPRSFTIAAAVDAALWLLATGVAFWCIRKRRIEQHRQWMTRSFAIALVFLQVRVIIGLTGWEQLGVAAVETVVWTCVAFAYPLADLTLLIDERLRARAADRARGTPPQAGDTRGAAAGVQADD